MLNVERDGVGAAAGGPVPYAGSLTIIAACLIAAWIPAARAARVDPMKTLRQE